MKKFTISDMLSAATKGNDILEYAERVGSFPKVKDLVPETAPDVFPKYVPGSSCNQKGQDHHFFKVKSREVCSKCGSSRAVRL